MAKGNDADDDEKQNAIIFFLALVLTPPPSFSQILLQEALRLKEAGHAEEVVAVSVGPKECQVRKNVAGDWKGFIFFSFSFSHDEARLFLLLLLNLNLLCLCLSLFQNSQEQLRTALALGADRVLHIDTTATGGSSSSPGSGNGLDPSSLPPQTPGPRAVASLLARVVAEEGPRLVLLGKQAIDGDSAQTGPMLAGLLNWPQATFASKLVLGEGAEGGGEGGGGAEAAAAAAAAAAATGASSSSAATTIRVTREVDGGLQTLSVPLPAVVTADLRLNEPRYASLPAVMKAKKAAVPSKSPADLGVDLSRLVAQQTVVSRVSPPPARKAGRKVGSVEELVEALVSEAKVL